MAFMKNNVLHEILEPSERRKSRLILFNLFLFNLFSLFGLALLLPYLGLLLKAEELILQEPYLGIVSLAGLEPSGFSLILLASVTYLVLLSLRAFLNILTNKQIFHFAASVAARVTDHLHRHYLGLPYSEFARLNSGTMVKNCTGTMEKIGEAFHAHLRYISFCMTTVMLTSLAIYKDPLISLFLLLVFFLLGVTVQRTFKRRLTQAGQHRERTNEEIHRLARESFLSFREIRLLGCFDYFRSRLMNRVNPHCDSLEAGYFYPTIPQIVAEFALVFVSILVVLISLSQNYPLEELTKELIFYLALAKWLLPAVTQAMSCRLLLTVCHPALVTAIKELSRPQDPNRYPAKEGPAFQDTLSLKNLRFSFSSQQEVLKGLSFSIKRNQSLALVGPSGAGKSTLIEILTSLLQPSEGTFYLDGNPQESLCFLKKQIGYVPQMVTLLDDSIAVNIGFGEAKVDRRRVEMVLKMAHLSDFIATLPKGMDTIVGERGTRLSGGQRQRIGIARALYRDPEILIFDEATSALDNVSEKIIGETIKELAGKKTLIVVAHRLSTIQNFDRILVMNSGQIVAEGTHEELLETSPDYQDLNLISSKKRKNKSPVTSKPAAIHV